jgi:hypothetical protein
VGKKNRPHGSNSRAASREAVHILQATLWTIEDIEVNMSPSLTPGSGLGKGLLVLGSTYRRSPESLPLLLSPVFATEQDVRVDHSIISTSASVRVG